MGKPIVCIDFDGVIHDYKYGWQNGVICGGIVPGFLDWAEGADCVFDLVVYSSRSGTPEGLERMRAWLDARIDAWEGARPGSIRPNFRYSEKKPPAFLTIDDRAITFQGDWRDPAFDPATLLRFKTWTQRLADAEGA